MAAIRELPSGKYQATIRLPDGKRRTYTHTLKRAAENWAREAERNRDLGLEFVDLRAGRKTLLSSWYELWLETLSVEQTTRATYESAWRVHIEPFLGDRGVGSISRMDVQKWQADLDRKHKGGKARVRGIALLVLSQMMVMATHSAPPLRVDNPCAGVKPPTRQPEPGRALSVDEARLLIRKLGEPDDLLVHLMLAAGLRWSEAAALQGDAFDWHHGTVLIRRALTQAGVIREHGKSTAARRAIPIPREVAARLLVASNEAGPNGLLFRLKGASRKHADGRLTYRNWLRDTWNPAVEAAGLQGLTPHDCRHSYITWAMAAGADEYKLQRLAGHESGAMTRRYTHLKPDHFTELLDAVPMLGLDAGDAPGTHELVSGVVLESSNTA